MFSIIIRLSIIVSCFVWLSSPGIVAAKSNNYEIMVHGGEIEETIAYFKSKNFWGKSTHNKDLDVPRLLIVVASKRWGKEAQKVPVEIKKELFYRALVPLILYANNLILKERQELVTISKILRKGKTLNAEQLSHLQSIGQKYGLEEVNDPQERVAQLLERVDVIPPSLALGQTAY